MSRALGVLFVFPGHLLALWGILFDIWEGCQALNISQLSSHWYKLLRAHFPAAWKCADLILDSFRRPFFLPLYRAHLPICPLLCTLAPSHFPLSLVSLSRLLCFLSPMPPSLFSFPSYLCAPSPLPSIPLRSSTCPHGFFSFLPCFPYLLPISPSLPYLIPYILSFYPSLPPFLSLFLLHILGCVQSLHPSLSVLLPSFQHPALPSFLPSFLCFLLPFTHVTNIMRKLSWQDTLPALPCGQLQPRSKELF